MELDINDKQESSLKQNSFVYDLNEQVANKKQWKILKVER